MARPSSYPPELRKLAVRMVAEIRGDYPTESAAINAVTTKLGIGLPVQLPCLRGEKDLVPAEPAGP